MYTPFAKTFPQLCLRFQIQFCTRTRRGFSLSLHRVPRWKIPKIYSARTAPKNHHLSSAKLDNRAKLRANNFSALDAYYIPRFFIFNRKSRRMLCFYPKSIYYTQYITVLMKIFVCTEPASFIFPFQRYGLCTSVYIVHSTQPRQKEKERYSLEKRISCHTRYPLFVIPIFLSLSLSMGLQNHPKTPDIIVNWTHAFYWSEWKLNFVLVASYSHSSHHPLINI